ncbi:NHL domain-containing thioredoxin family protein [Nocardioides sp. GY 10127]|uniref:NHL domain-containing thioredoxin family protein n=1 Tax=Nocardioides sp. GY 10127 TaxID=2569762 RepID=UPI0010A768AB|nr:NHL domain-containing thioredoxin family protein [Nocardioides sp. GY 10127]TIC82924.1 redoxin domain-containing protein [Nocardioides sp. GY 10127]
MSSTQNPGTRPRVRAPELVGRGWLNTGGETIRVADLRGRFVLLDFWTFCCINCLHVLDELRETEERFAEELVVVGVHSPKFVHEADPDALAAAVERYGVAHPVLDDPDLVTWQAYTARAWPTLVLIDPEGYVVAQYAGEGHAHAIAALLAELVPLHRERGTLQPGDSPYVPPVVEPSDLRFPAKAVPISRDTAAGRVEGVLVADAGHDEVVLLAAGGDDGTVLRRFGGFREPNGLCLLPEEVAAEVGYDVVVADTAAHRLVGLSPATGETRTLAGDGTQWMQGDGTERLSSPWDVAWWGDRVWVAMAGVHQLWTFDPRTGEVAVAAGTTNEGLLDGAPAEAWFAQTSGLAADGDRLWLADSETSSLRVLERATERATGEAGGGLVVRTIVGSGLFDFGFRDGPADQALLQHPLGVTVLPDGSVAVCDTYNGAVRRYDPATGEVGTLASGLAEPSGAFVDGEHLVVVESTAHRLVRLRLDADVVATDGFSHSTQRPVTEVAAGLRLVVSFTPPPGQKVDDRFGPPSQLMVESTPPGLIRSGGGRGTDLVRTIELDPHAGEGVLHVAARAASCDAHGGEGAACRMHQQDWGVPVRVVDGAPDVLTLPLGGAE